MRQVLFTLSLFCFYSALAQPINYNDDSAEIHLFRATEIDSIKKDYWTQLDSTDTELEQVVISATKWRQSRDKSPLKVISVKSADIVLQNPQTAADLLGNSGAVFIQKSQQGGGSPMIRGFAANRLIYTVDGVRMNTAIFRGGNLQNVISLDALSLESAEVLLGPDAVVYGSDAIGGVMSFETLGPKFSDN